MARALAAHPTVILLDEPFGALDAITRSDLQEMFAGVRKRRPVTALLVTHDLFEAQRLADRIAVMRAGRIEHIGTPRRDQRRRRPPTTSLDWSRGRGCGGWKRPADELRMNLTLALALAFTVAQGVPRSRPIIVASKPFGESYILCEMFAQLLEARGFRVDRRPGSARPKSRSPRCARMRSTCIRNTQAPGCSRSSATPPVGRRLRHSLCGARSSAGNIGTRWLPPLGFENTYAISVRRETADALCTAHVVGPRACRADAPRGFTADFIGRGDGLPGLSRSYGLQVPRGTPLSER